jgi:hypothetical protein
MSGANKGRIIARTAQACRKCGLTLAAGEGETTDGLCAPCYSECFEAPVRVRGSYAPPDPLDD